MVLPGVRAFGDAMTNLCATGLDRAIQRVIRAEKPFLGICLGQQLFLKLARSGAILKGLGVFPGACAVFPTV